MQKAFVRNPGNDFFYSCATLVDVTSEYCVKRVICKTWTGFSAGTLANSADPDQILHIIVSDQGLHCLPERHEVKG